MTLADDPSASNDRMSDLTSDPTKANLTIGSEATSGNGNLPDNNLSNSSLLEQSVPVIDYEGSHYKSDFWLGQGRDYEDAVERLVLAELLPKQGGRIAEIGAGFGRLADLYLGYEQIVLFDYSRTLLQDAVKTWGHDPRFVFVAGNIYQLPLATGVLDSLAMVRVMHHLADVPMALQQLARVLHSRSVAIVEYANKRNLKAILRWLAMQQAWSPFQLEPVEFVKLNFDFHPLWMEQQFAQSELTIKARRAVSHFRLPFLKERISAHWLASIDQKLFGMGEHLSLSPSVFLQSELAVSRKRVEGSTGGDSIAALFCCPSCRVEAFQLSGPDRLVCQSCQTSYVRQDGIWDFKEEA